MASLLYNCLYLVGTPFEAETVLIDFNCFLGFKASTILRVVRIVAQYKEYKYVFVLFFIYFEMFLKYICLSTNLRFMPKFLLH